MEQKKKYKRPDYIERYKPQLDFILDTARFIIIEATTKAGKSVGCLVWIFEESIRIAKRVRDPLAVNMWWIAPTYPTAKIMFNRMKRFLPRWLYVANESELYIQCKHGPRFWFKGADKPDSLYGEDVYGAVIDEGSRMKDAAWTAVLSTLTATKGRCVIIGNVKGTGNWMYDAARKAEKGEKNWSYHKITASDAVKYGVLDPEVIEDAKRILPTPTFLELYYGIPDEQAAGVFCYAFSKEKHVGMYDPDPMLPLYLSFDFNYNPMTCGVYQMADDGPACAEIIKLAKASIYDVCDAIKTKYSGFHWIVNGDYSGVSKDGHTQDALSYFEIIQQQLGLNDAVMQYKVNPRLEKNRVLVNGILEHQDVIMDEEKAQPLIFDCQFCQVDTENKIVKTDRKDPKQQADALDTFRYFLNANYGDLLNEYM